MKWLLLFAIASLMLTGIAQAQEKAKPASSLRRDAAPIKPAATQPQREVYPERVSISMTETPEMWFYEQERLRYEDPKSAVRRNAELRSAQRADRIASMKWYGMSNSRPACSATPLTGSYSPTWVSTNPFDPYHWRPGYDTSATIILVR